MRRERELNIETTWTEGESTSALLHAWRVVRERWWAVLTFVVLGVGIAVALALTAPNQYDATAKLLVRESGLSNAVSGTTVFEQSPEPQRDASTNVLLAKSNTVLEGVRRQLRLDRSADDLLAQTRIELEENADVVDITVRDPDPRLAANIANAFANQYVLVRRNADRAKVQEGQRLVRQRLSALPAAAEGERQQLEEALQKLVLLESVQTGNAELFDRASAPDVAATPKPRRDALIGALLGFALGLAAAFLLDVLDRRLKTVEDFEEAYGGLPVLASIPQSIFDGRTDETRRAALEPYSILAASLEFQAVERPIKVMLITSALAGEGKTTVAVNLARAAAANGQRVALVEADLRRPSFSSHFDLRQATSGLTSQLLRRGELMDHLHHLELSLFVMPSGPLPPSPPEILRSGQVRALLTELSEGFDLVIVDGPPLLPVADARILVDQAVVDAYVVVVRSYRNTRQAAHRTLSVVAQRRTGPLGLVVCGTREHRDYSHYYMAEEDEVVEVEGLSTRRKPPRPRAGARA